MEQAMAMPQEEKAKPRKKTTVVTNPDVDPGLKKCFTESGHKNINVCLKVGQDVRVALILPKIGGKE